MIDLIITLFILLFITYYICDILHTKFGKVIPLSYCVIVIIQYVAAITGKLSSFKYVLIGFLFLMLIHLLFRHRKNLKELYQNKYFFSVSMIVFVLLFIYLHFNLSNVYIQNVDDLGYWGTRLDDMFRNDSLYTVDKFVPYPGKAYPPFTHLLEFGMAKLLGGLNDHNVILALSSCTCSFFMFIFDKFEFNADGLIKSVVLFIGMIVLTLCISLNPTNNNPSYIFNSIYVDWLLSVALMYGFYQIYKFGYNEIYDYVCLGIVSFVLIFTKQIGLALALLLYATLLIKMFFDKQISIKNIAKFLIISIVIPVMIYYSWNVYASLIFNNTVGGISSSIPVDESFISGGFSSTAAIKQIIDFFVFTLYEPVMMHPIRLSYFIIILSVTVALIVYGRINKEKLSYYVIPVFYFLGSIGYALGIELSYISLFADGNTYPLYGRYMQTYTYFGFLLVFVLIYEKIKKKEQFLIPLLASCLFVNTKSIDTFIYNDNRELFRAEERQLIREWVDNEYNYQNIVVINQTDIRYRNLMIKLFGEKGENADYVQFFKDKNVQDMIDLLSDYEYILIGDSDNHFIEVWNQITDVPAYNSTLYKITNDGSGIKLEMVYVWELNN